ncbi:MAG: VanW family protein [Patescibacteria group bacterium]
MTKRVLNGLELKGILSYMAKGKEKKKLQIKINFDFLKSKYLRYVALGIAAILILLLITFGIYSISYAHKSYKNIKIGDIALGGKTEGEIKDILQTNSNQFLAKNIILSYQGDNPKDYQVAPADIGLAYDVDGSMKRVMGIGRDRGIFRDFWEQLKSVFSEQNVPMLYSVNDSALSDKIAAIAKEVDIPEKDYSISYQGGEFVLSTERAEGKRIDQLGLINNVKYQISNVKSNPIAFNAQKYVPQVDEVKAQKRLSEAQNILSGGDLVLNYKDFEFTLGGDDIGKLILSKTDGDDLKLYVSSEQATNQIKNMATTINSEPVNAQFSVVGGSVTAFAVSKDGLKLDENQTKVDIENALLGRVYKVAEGIDTKKISLKVAVTKPAVSSDDAGKYGLKELVSTGVTTFTGSPSNRIHNINVGAAAINGALLAPGETFSTLGRLGKIDASTGYLPELVIKNDKTVPDYGGGLCQVSTTLFRAALNSGMEIVERQNHSYRVSYYEPPVGMDATIFDPAPDFKFKNNYNSYILIQAQVVGTKITFQFYGTKDSRIISIGTPSVYDVISPPTPLEIPTDTLKVGEKKKIDSGHPGATASFHYKVTRDGAILQEKDFVSKYVPWQEKWLVGTVQPEPVPEPAPEPTPEPATPTADPATPTT